LKKAVIHINPQLSTFHSHLHPEKTPPKLLPVWNGSLGIKKFTQKMFLKWEKVLFCGNFVSILS